MKTFMSVMTVTIMTLIIRLTIGCRLGKSNNSKILVTQSSYDCSTSKQLYEQNLKTRKMDFKKYIPVKWSNVKSIIGKSDFYEHSIVNAESSSDYFIKKSSK